MSATYRTITLPNAFGVDITAASDGGLMQVAWSTPGWHGPTFAFKTAAGWTRTSLVVNPERFGTVGSRDDALAWAKRFNEESA